jgi:XTP/dITP diphosphohydrolase
MQKVVLATGNAGKVRELASLLNDFGLDVVAQTDLAWIPPKRRADVYRKRDPESAPCRADYRPARDCRRLRPGRRCSWRRAGIYSARYSGVDATDQQNLEKLLVALKDVPDDQRRRSSTACWSICAMRKTHADRLPRQLAGRDYP